MEHAATVGGERTPAGYRVRFLLSRGFGLHRPLALDQRDFVGLAIIVVDAGRGPTAFHESSPPQRAHDQYANSLMILDLKDRLNSDGIVSLHVFPPVPVPAKPSPSRRSAGAGPLLRTAEVGVDLVQALLATGTAQEFQFGTGLPEEAQRHPAIRIQNPPRNSSTKERRRPKGRLRRLPFLHLGLRGRSSP